jgi:outer membrane protein TolC
VYPILILGIVLLGQAKGKPDPDQFPLALHRSMEIDDLDREIQRLHDTATFKRAQLATSQRLSQRGLLSRSDLERETADLHHVEAREAESVAYRALKAYERDVLGQATPPDEQKAYSLLLDLVRKQLAIAQVDVDFRDFNLKQSRALYTRHSISRPELEDAELAYDTAQASLALSRSREAQILMELAARIGAKPYDPREYHHLKEDYLSARVRYFEITAEGTKHRLEIARERSKLGLIPTSDLSFFERAAAEADASLASERKALDRHKEDRPFVAPKTPARRISLHGERASDNVSV